MYSMNTINPEVKPNQRGHRYNIYAKDNKTQEIELAHTSSNKNGADAFMRAVKDDTLYYYYVEVEYNG